MGGKTESLEGAKDSNFKRKPPFCSNFDEISAKAEGQLTPSDPPVPITLKNMCHVPRLKSDSQK